MRRNVSTGISAAIKGQSQAYDRSLSLYACKNCDAVRRRPDHDDIRQPFFHDGDRIVHSRAYARYIDKTQVFYLVKNDHITHRVLHVQLVSKIARLIGRSLQLNEDLIEAIALGHDIGHAPYGHDGETYLSKCCVKHGIGGFHHNAQSVWALDRIENLNLTLQALDGILAHNGEAHDFVVRPSPDKSWEVLDEEMARSMSQHEGYSGIMPMTMEGCVVRVADTISYVGRDIEDAITLGLITREEVPADCGEVLGSTNRDIVNNLVVDVIENSYNKDYIALSDEMARGMKALKDFNYRHIYTNSEIKSQSAKIQNMFDMMFDALLDDVRKNGSESRIYVSYAKALDSRRLTKYLDGLSGPEIVRDFIAGMTDDYFNDMFRELFLPAKKARY
ncbi:deoxyguanosinetriphosphate triphosphohydrolase family protein [Methanocella sp. MCL-LM]|uniref:deoxyguanosinetriphosphate triphosphohydrolase family protein n=1 Tax=Methanocella sp. MCL-LM TaxID=3412035 RepID=UPI003C77B507